MNLAKLIQEIDAEIARLQTVKSLLSETPAVIRKIGRPRKGEVASHPRRKVMSTEARAKIAAAQRARWAKSRKSSKKNVQSKTN